MSISLRPLHPEDIELACRLLRISMPEKEYNHTIFACSGYSRYLRASSSCGRNAATLLIGAYEEERLVGFAEWRRLEQMLVLNNLNVEEAGRCKGIGGRLVAYGETLAREEGVRTLALDVFAWNESAHAWYTRLGFTETGRTYWYEGLQAVGETDGAFSEYSAGMPYIIDDYPMAEAHHAAYGFSSFRIRTKQGSTQVGRLGDHYYRLQLKASDWEGDGMLASVLMQLDPRRKLLVLSPEPRLSELDPGLAPLSESIRMIKMLEAVDHGGD